jgi:hypothetical protein
VEALQKNYLAADSDLYIFSDAAKGELDAVAVTEVRKYIQSVGGFKSITIYESQLNKGLAKSIIEGVSQVLENHEEVIVLEDDLITSNNFLDFMNLALDTYKQNKKVFSISGYGLKVLLPEKYEYDVYFTPRGMSWGWSTWRDRWENIDWEVKDFKQFKANEKAKKGFAMGGTDLNTMLEKQIDGKIDSWAIRWYFNQFKNEQLTVFPIKSKVINLGFDNMATHTNAYNRYKISFDIENSNKFIFSNEVTVNPVIFKSFKSYFGILSRIFYGRIISPLYRFKQSFISLIKEY